MAQAEALDAPAPFSGRDARAWRLTRIETYVASRSLFAVGIALGVIATLILLINFVDVSRNVGAKADASTLDVLELTLLKSPNIILVLLPFAFLFGTLGAFVGLNRRSELVAMRAAGVSAWRFIFPAAAAAVLIGLLTIFALNPLAAWMNAKYEDMSLGILLNVRAPAAKAIWLRQGDRRSQVVIHALSREPGSTRLHDVQLFVYTIADKGTLEFSRLIEAREAALRPGFWQLTGAREAGPGEQALVYDTLSIPSDLKPETAFETFAKPASIPFWSLPQIIARIEHAGFSPTAYRLRFQQLLAIPVLFAAMSILGAAFSLRLMRLGGLAVLATSGVALGFVFFFFNQLCGSLGRADVIPPLLAAWSPPLLALLSAFTLLCYTEDG